MPSSLTRVEDLPNEVLHIIIFHLDIGPLSTSRLHQEPSASFTSIEGRPLKNFSQTCKRYRSLIFESLFQFCKVRLVDSTFEVLCDEQNSFQSPCYQVVQDFLSFVVENKLSQNVKSLLFFTEHDLGSRVPGLTPSPLPAENKLELGQLWPSVFSVVRPDIITICAPPSTLAFLTSCGIYVGNAWAFSTPLHILQLRVRSDLSRDIPTSSLSASKLFSSLPWTHCTLNEGSALQVYNTYEYHSMVQPSILNGRLRDDSSATPRLLTALRSFDYIAIFPLYGQVVKMLSYLFVLPKLQRVAVQLAPQKENKILEDQSRVLRSLYSDLWMEFENTYFLIATNIVQAETESSVNEFVCLDYQQEGLWESLGNGGAIMSEHWQIISDGHWKKIETATTQ
ncbi:hypothetical protein MMC19_007627 [Ptychographa xylographoides]|nr:hypothetical protein [Ptychographa xylographoides]